MKTTIALIATMVLAGATHAAAQTITITGPATASVGDIYTLNAHAAANRDTLCAAEERAAGRLTARELLRLRLAAQFRPKAFQEAALTCMEQAYASGHPAAPAQGADIGAFDWSQLLAFIKEFLPVLLELLKLFS